MHVDGTRYTSVENRRRAEITKQQFHSLTRDTSANSTARERGVCLALKEYYSAKERYMTSKNSASSGMGSRSFNMSASSSSTTSRISTFTVSLAPLSVPLLVYALRISYLKGCLYLAAPASALVLLLTLVCERRVHSMRLYQQRQTTCPPTLQTPPSQAKCLAILRSGISEVQAGLYGEPAKGEFSAEWMWMEEIALEVNRLACTVGLEPQDPQTAQDVMHDQDNAGML
eukprot:jgi/Tetstr1/459302/TSEL_004697.t1